MLRKNFFKITPLGFNCELAFVLQARGYSQDHEVFAWTFARLHPIVNLIKNEFADICSTQNLQPHPGGELVWDVAYDISFHSILHRGGVSHFGKESFSRLYAFFLAGVEKKTRDFMEELRSDHAIAYLIKYDGNSAREDAVLLRETIGSQRGNSPFHIIFVQESEREEPDWKEELISNRYVSNFSPIEDAQAIDHKSWADALNDLILEKPLG